MAAKDDGKRKFTVRFDDGTEMYTLTGQSPHCAAVKAARRLVDPDGFDNYEDAKENNQVRLFLRELGSRTLHVHDVYTWWKEDACPVCESRRTYVRKEKEPKYRCGACRAEFELPLRASSLETDSDLPEYLDSYDKLIEAEADSRGRSKVPEDDINL